MNKKWIVLPAAVALAFGVITMLKNGSSDAQPSPGGGAALHESRSSIGESIPSHDARSADKSGSRTGDAPGPHDGADVRHDREAVVTFWDLYRRATSHRVAGRITEAAAAYRGALLLNPEHEDALYYLGNVYMDLEQMEDAERAWGRLVNVNPRSARGHARLGDLYVCSAGSTHFHLHAAEDAYRRALQINRQETGPALRLGLVRLLLGDLSEAERHLSAVVAENFRSVSGHFYLGYLAWKDGNADRAVALFEGAASLVRTSAAARGGPVVGEGDTRVDETIAGDADLRPGRPVVDDTRPVGSSEAAIHRPAVGGAEMGADVGDQADDGPRLAPPGADEFGCDTFERFLIGLEDVPAHRATDEMSMRYRGLDRFLRTVR